MTVVASTEPERSHCNFDDVKLVTKRCTVSSESDGSPFRKALNNIPIVDRQSSYFIYDGQCVIHLHKRGGEP